VNVADIAVVIAAVAAIAGVGWFFFAPRRALAAELAGGVQRITVTVRGGYSPDVIRVRQGCRWRWCSTGRSLVTVRPGWSSLTWR
jgi:Cu+-exporting ATPase